MRLVSRLFAYALLGLLPLACSSGGGGGSDATANSFIGTWNITGVQTSTTCTSTQFADQQDTITITVTDGVASFFDGSIQVPIVDGRIQGYSAFNLSTYDWALTGANSFEGTQTSAIPASGNDPACEVVFRITGTRVGAPDPDPEPQPTPNTQDWIGTWDITAVQSSTTCNPDPQFGPQSATITITITTNGTETVASFFNQNIQIPVVNGRIQGYSPYNLTTYDWQLNGANSFSGTQTSGLLTGGGCEVVFQVTGTRVGS